MEYLWCYTDEQVTLLYQKDHPSDRKLMITKPTADNPGLYIGPDGSMGEIGFVMFDNNMDMYTEQQLRDIWVRIANPQTQHVHDWVLREVTEDCPYVAITILNSHSPIVYHRGTWSQFDDDADMTITHTADISQAFYAQIKAGGDLMTMPLPPVLARARRLQHVFSPNRPSNET